MIVDSFGTWKYEKKLKILIFKSKSEVKEPI